MVHNLVIAAYNKNTLRAIQKEPSDSSSPPVMEIADSNPSSKNHEIYYILRPDFY